jgi:hypothetical protein
LRFTEQIICKSGFFLKLKLEFLEEKSGTVGMETHVFPVATPFEVNANCSSGSSPRDRFHPTLS